MLLAEYVVATAGALGCIGVVATYLAAWWQRDFGDTGAEPDDAMP